MRALVALTFALVACAAFVGPSTKAPACPVLCGQHAGHDVCCRYDEECSRTGFPDRPCRPSLGLARDAGGDG